MRRAILAPLAGALAAACSPARVVDLFTPRSGYAVTRGIRYAAHGRGLLDLYEPEGLAAEAPLVVFFHGGGWKTGSREEYGFAGQALGLLGARVAIPDYRLHPEARWPDFVEDAAEAVEFLRVRHAGPLVAMGHSAGAFNAVALAVDPRWGAQRMLHGAVGLAGPYAFGPEYEGYAPIFAAAPDGWARVLPEGASPAGSPPLLLLHGGADRIAWPLQSTRLAARAQAAGVEARAVIYPDVGHLGILTDLTAPGRALGLAKAPVLAEMRGFLAGLQQAELPAEGVEGRG